MLTAAVVTHDVDSIVGMRSSLQETGLVSAVLDWPLERNGDWRRHASDPLPDVVLMDISEDVDYCFAMAGQLRRLRPTVYIIACSSVQTPDPQLLLQAMRNGIQEFLPKPVSSSALQNVLERCIREKGSPENALHKKLILVMGAKGGVGTTTISVNLAVQLVNLTKKRVALLDFGRPVGHAGLLLDLRSSYSLRDATDNLARLDGHFFAGLLTSHKSRLKVLAGASHPEDWQRIPAASLETVLGVAQRNFDYVVVDCGSMYSAEWNRLARLDPILLMVAQTDVPALWSLERHLSVATAHGIKSDRIHIAINRWTRGDDEALKSVQKNIKRPIQIRFPNDFRKVSEATNLGVPLSRNHSNGLVTKFQMLAAKLADVELGTQSKRSLLGSLFTY